MIPNSFKETTFAKNHPLMKNTIYFLIRPQVGQGKVCKKLWTINYA
jgi:hypothetical protein